MLWHLRPNEKKWGQNKYILSKFSPTHLFELIVSSVHCSANKRWSKSAVLPDLPGERRAGRAHHLWVGGFIVISPASSPEVLFWKHWAQVGNQIKKKKSDLISSCQVWNEKNPLVLSSVVTSVDVVEQLVTQTGSNIWVVSNSFSGPWVPICTQRIPAFFWLSERIKRSKQGEQEGDVIRQHKIFSLLLHMKLQHTSNQLVTASPAVQLYHRELRTLPRSGDRCWSNQSSPSSLWHCHTHNCELAHLWMCVSQVLRVFDFAIPCRELQLFSKVGRCNSCPARSRPVLTFNIFWTGSGGTFAYYQLLKFLFPFHPTNISPSQTQRVILYIVFEMYTHFSRRLFQGEQHTCRYFGLAKEKEKDNATAENWSMTFLMFVFFFSVPAKIQ